MKIKKKTSMMLLAASAAAVVGISAVSYAAWTGGTQSFTANASTGYIQVLGWENVPVVDVAKDLMPYDQEDYDTETFTNVITVEIPAYEYTVNHTLTIQSDNENISLKYLYGNYATVTVEKGMDLTGWTDITTAQADVMETIADGDATTGSKTHDTVYVHIILNSNNPKHMNEEFNVTIALVETTSDNG